MALALPTLRCIEVATEVYRTSVLLWKHRQMLETGLAQRELSLSITPEAIILYDMTNVHGHGRAGEDQQFGHSEQIRNANCCLVWLRADW